MDVVRAVSGVFCAACAMGAAVWVFDRAVDSTIPQAGLLAAEVILGAAMYTALVHFLSLQPYEELRTIVRERRVDRENEPAPG